MRDVPVNQGDVIMEADDTGTSFHSHLHIDVVMDASGAWWRPLPATARQRRHPVRVPRSARRGPLLNLTWYESENG